jgi:hypothetical protein
MKTFNRCNFFITTITTIIITIANTADTMMNRASSWFPVDTAIITITTTTIITASIAAIIDDSGCEDFELQLRWGLSRPCFLAAAATARPVYIGSLSNPM